MDSAERTDYALRMSCITFGGTAPQCNTSELEDDRTIPRTMKGDQPREADALLASHTHVVGQFEVNSERAL